MKRVLLECSGAMKTAPPDHDRMCSFRHKQGHRANRWLDILHSDIRWSKCRKKGQSEATCWSRGKKESAWSNIYIAIEGYSDGSSESEEDKETASVVIGPDIEEVLAVNGNS